MKILAPINRAKIHILVLAFCVVMYSLVAWAAQNSGFLISINNTPLSSTTIKPGQSTSLRIALTNNTVADFTGVGFSKALPSGATGGLVINGTPVISEGPNTVGGTCSAGALTTTIGSASLTLSGLTVPAKDGSNPGICYIDIPVTATSTDGSSTSYTYSLAAGEVTMSGGDSNGTGGSQSFTVLATSRPTWSKSFSTSSATLGGADVNLVFNIANPSTGVPLTGVNFTDVFPVFGGNGSIIEPTGTGVTTSNCGASPNVVTTSGAASQVAVSDVSIATGATCTITVPVKARQTSGQYQLLNQTNTVSASGFDSDQGLRPASDASANITVKSPLSISKWSSATYVASGQAATFTIRLSNSGSSALPVTNFDESAISNTVAGQQLTPTLITNSCGGTNTVSSPGFSTSGYSIPAGGSCDIVVTFIGTTAAQNQPLTFTNTIPQGAVVTSTPGVVSQPASATVSIVDELLVSKTQNRAYAAPGSAVQYSINVKNFSSSARNNLHVTDALQNGATLLRGSGYEPSLSGTGCGTLTTSNVQGDTSLDFVVGTLPAYSGGVAGSCTVNFWAQTSKSANASTSNEILACGVYYGTQSAPTCNGWASNTVTANYQQPLVVGKTFNGADYSNVNYSKSENNAVKMRIRLSNYSDAPLSNATLADTLPLSGSQQLRIATPANLTNTCGGSVTAAEGTTSLALNGGSVPATSGPSNPGTCEISVDVVGPAGIYNNTAIAGATQSFADGTDAAITNISSNTATLTYNSTLSATKAFSPNSIAAGGKSQVSVTLTNLDAISTLTGVSVTDPLPAGLKLANPTNMYSTCNGTKTYAGNAGDTTATMNGASIAAGGTCQFLFDVVSDGTGSGNWVNSIPSGNIIADGGIKNQTPVTATLVRTASQIPTISKSITPESVSTGQVAQLVISINNGTQALTGLGVTDYFTTDGTSGAASNGLKIAAEPSASTTCPGGLVTASPGATYLRLSGATLVANGSCSVTVNIVNTNAGTATNTIPTSAIVSDQGQTNTSTFASASLQTSTNLGIQKSFNPMVIKSGERSRLKISIYNPTAVATSAISITDNLPAGVTIPTGPNVVQNCGATVNVSDSSKVEITNASVGAASVGVSASCYVELDVTSATSGVYTNTIPANSMKVSGSPVTHPATTAALRVAQPLVLHKAIDSKTLDSGNPSPFSTSEAVRGAGIAAKLTIRIENPNATVLTQASLTDALPSGLVVALTPNASTTCSGGTVTAPASSTSVRLTGATIPASGACALTVDVLSNTPGSYTNTLPSSAITTLEGVSNEEGTSARLLVSKPPAITKQFDPAVMPGGSHSRLTIFLENDNTFAITTTQALTDALPSIPAVMSIDATPALTTTCGGSVPTGSSGATSLIIPSGTTIPAGGCSVSVNVTASVAGTYNNTITSGSLQTNVGQNAVAANAQLQVNTLGYISGKVFKDYSTTPNGLFDAGDSPISGVTISLYSGNSCSGSPIATKVTDLAGNYLFYGLSVGSYSVCEPNQPSGTVNSITTAGTIQSIAGSTGSAGTASNPTSSTSQVVGITLGDNGSGGISGSVNNNFSEIILSSISGNVFKDFNDNGVFNGTDTPLTAVTIELLNSSNAVIATTTTSADGSYVFQGLQPGTYSVREVNQPADTINGQTIPGTVTIGAVGSAKTVSPSLISNIVLGPGVTATDNNFAEIPSSRTLSGTIFFDQNDNGTQDANESGISAQIVNLTGNDINNNPVTRSATTAADGSYSFTDLPPGTYNVTQPSQPSSTLNGQTIAGSTGGTPTSKATTPSSISAIDLTGSHTLSVGNDFAEIPINHSLSGRVYSDAIDNGIFDGADLGIINQRIELSGTDVNGNSVSRFVLTAADGTYNFTNLPPGTYSVTQPNQPVGYLNGQTIPGSLNGTATAKTVTPSSISAIVISPAVLSATGYDFAEIPNDRVISGRVFVDINNDGVINGSDQGIVNQTITLSGTDQNGGGISPISVVTGSDGSYSFAGLAAGTYVVTQSTIQPTVILDGQSITTINGKTIAGSAGGNVTLPTASPSQISAIALTGSTVSSSGNNFGEFPNTRSISGTVFLDINSDAIKNGPDYGISGQTILLDGTDINGNIIPTKSAITLPDGSYSFTNLPAGTYVIRQPNQPSDTVNGDTIQGSAGGTPSAIATLPSTISSVDLSTVVTSTGNNFAERPIAGPDLAISKVHSQTSFPDGGNTGFFTITPKNVGSVDTSGLITVLDTFPTGMTLASPATGSGWSCSGIVGASSVTCTSSNVIKAASDGNPIIVRVAIASGLAGNTLKNNVSISGGNEATGFSGNNSTSDSVLISASARISGTVWMDSNHDRKLDSGEKKLSGWKVEVLLGGVQVATGLTGNDGKYAITGLAPASGYQVRFRDPASGNLYGEAVTNEQGINPSATRDTGASVNTGTNSGNPAGASKTNGTLTGMTLVAGDNIVEQSLPLDPSGVVYDAVTRQPISGATITLSGPAGFDPATHLLSGTASQITGSDGWYQFLLLAGAPSGTYTLAVTPPSGSSYISSLSSMIPPCQATLVVGSSPAPALVQSSSTAPASSVPIHSASSCAGIVSGGVNSTQYYTSFNLNVGTSANVVNNHIPLDPILGGAIVMTKTTPLINVSKGDLVPYTITATNTLSATLNNINVKDELPPGFKYLVGSAKIGGVTVEPVIAGRMLTWPNQTFSSKEKKTYKLVLVVGSGVGEGEYVNQTWSINNLVNRIVSNTASATVRVVPDPTFDCSDIIGKVFDDKNVNGYQDDGEDGIPNVRLATVKGLLVTTDANGRFHIPCAEIPQSDHGSNFIMKLDERTLPSGYRLTTENPRDVRVTRGKLAKLNFGAAIHKVIRVEVNQNAFVGNSVQLSKEWEISLIQVVKQLQERPSVLRLAYSQGHDSELAMRRLDELQNHVKQLYEHSMKVEESNDQHIPPLIIEIEPFVNDLKGAE